MSTDGHTRRGEKYVTVISDLTPIGDAAVRRGRWIWSRPIEAGVQDLARRARHVLARLR